MALQKPRTGRTGYSLKTRLYTIIGFLGLLPVLGVIFAFVTMSNATRDNAALDRAARGTIHLERINGLVYAVVMESRGIYMSADWKSAVVFQKRMSNQCCVIRIRIASPTQSPVGIVLNRYDMAQRDTKCPMTV